MFKLLEQHSLLAKRSKCHFAQPRVEYLGYFISPERVSTDPRKVEMVQQWPTPRNISQLRGFLSFTSYYRRFVKGYGCICKPLVELLKKDKFQWTKEAKKAFQNLKQVNTSPPILALLDYTQDFIIEKDAFNMGI